MGGARVCATLLGPDGEVYSAVMEPPDEQDLAELRATTEARERRGVAPPGGIGDATPGSA